MDPISVTVLDQGGNPVSFTLDGTNLSIDPAQFAALDAGESATVTVGYDIIDGRGGVTPNTATLSVDGVDDASAPTVSIAGTPTAVESGDEGTQTTLLFDLAYTGGANETRDVTYTVNGDARTATVTFLDGAGSLAVSVDNDDLANGTDNVTVVLTGIGDNVTDMVDIAARTATGTVSEDDFAPVAVAEPVEDPQQLGSDTLAGGEATAAEGAPGERHRAGAHAVVERAVAHRVEMERREFGLVRCDRKRQVSGERLDLCRRVVRHADLADLALVAQRDEGGRDVGWVGEQVRAVDLVEVDHLDAHPLQRCLARRAEVLGRRVVGDRRHDAALGGQHHPIPQVRRDRQDSPEILLDAAEARAAPVEAVDVGVVDQVHSGIECRLEQRLCRRDVRVRVAPQTERERPDGRQRSDRAQLGLDEIHLINLVADALAGRWRISP